MCISYNLGGRLYKKRILQGKLYDNIHYLQSIHKKMTIIIDTTVFFYKKKARNSEHDI